MPLRTPLTFGTRLEGTLAEVRPAVEAALKAEGFGVLTEIDVQATLHARLGLDMEPYVILGACNPALAHRAIVADPSVGALLPCNVVLRADPSGHGIVVEAMDPIAGLALLGSPAIESVAVEAASRLGRVIRSLGEAATVG